MKKQLSRIIQNISYAVVSNGVVMLSSTLVSFFVPLFYSVSLYGYLQLYLFYSSYLGLFNIGWLEGIYLRIGGISYDSVDVPLYRAQYKVFRAYVFGISIICCILTFLFVSDDMRRTIFFGVSICILPYVLTNYWNNFLLSTGRMKEYARNCFCDRIVFLIIVGIMIVLRYSDLRGIILADISGKTMAFLSARAACKNIYGKDGEKVDWKFVFSEIWTNICCGIKLLVANLSSMFILGSIRMGIEHAWSIEVYSQMSLTLSVSNMLLGFITAVSQVIYTTARKVAGSKLTDTYKILRKIIVIMLMGFMLAYYPVKELLIMLLPKYEYGLRYMAILLPMCVIECKWSFLTLTFLKVIREEKNILKVNVFSVLLSIVLTVIAAFLMRNLLLTVCIVIVVLFIRGTLGEKVLMDRMKCNLEKDVLKEAAVILSFILISWNIDSWLCMILYAGVYIVYILTEWTALKAIYADFKLIYH